MADFRLLEDGTSKRLLEDGTSFRLLEPLPSGAVYVASSSSAGSTPSNPSGNASHVLLAAAYSASGTANISTPTGWTAIANNRQGNSNVQLFWALGNVGSLAFTNAAIVQVLAFSGVDTTTPVRGSVAWTITNSEFSTTAIPSNTANAGDAVFVGCFSWQNGTGPSMLIASPYTQAQNTLNTDLRGSTGYISLASAGETPAYNVPTQAYTDRTAFNVILAGVAGGGGTATGSYTASSSVLNTQTNSFSASSSIRNTATTSFTASNSVLNSQTGTFNAAFSIQGLSNQTGSYTTSFSIANSQTASFTASSTVRNTQTASYIGASSVLNNQTGSFNSAFSLRNTQTQALTVSSSVLNTQTDSYTATSSIQGLNQAFGSYSSSYSVLNTVTASYTAIYSIDGILEEVIVTGAKNTFTYRGGRLARRSSGASSFVQFLPDDFIDQEAKEIPRIKLTAPDQSAEIIQAYLDDIKAKEKKQAKSKQQRIAKQANQERAINALAKRLAKEAMRLAELSKQKMLELQQQEDEMILQLLFEMV